MHYRSWVFLALFGLAGVSAAEDAKPVSNTSADLTEEDVPSPKNAAPPKARPTENCGSPLSDGSEPGGPSSRRKCAITGSSKVYIPPQPNPRSIPERLGQSDIMAVVLAHKPNIVRCVNAQKKSEPGLTGRLVMRWEIRTNGSTQNVRSRPPEFDKTLVARCLTEEIQSWTFPRHKIQGDPIDFPFTF